MKRRAFITMLGGSAIALAFSRAASAQGRQARIGLLMPVSPPAAYLAAFREGLRERGYVEGQNLSIDVRWPPGPFEQNSSVVAELVRANVDVIVAWSTPALMAAGRATSTIPIVGVSVSDLVGTGLVASLARPGGNVTGVTPINPDLSGKLVELLREIVPAIKHVGVLVNPANPGSAVQMPGVEDAARAMGLQLKIVEARNPEEFARGFARLSENRAQGVVLLADRASGTDCRACAERAPADCLSAPGKRRGGRPLGIRCGQQRPVPSGGLLRRSDLKGGQAGQSAGATTG
jgi:putative ABC transport system substrate-binding protein